MHKSFWEEKDFDVFTIDGLEKRMEALQARVQPKFELLGRLFADHLSSHGTDEFYPHVAKHARRTVNPLPTAGLPSLQQKGDIKRCLISRLAFGRRIYSSFWPSSMKTQIKRDCRTAFQTSERPDRPACRLYRLRRPYEAGSNSNRGSRKRRDRSIVGPVTNRKKAEFLVGRHLDREAAVKMTEPEFLAYAEETINRLLPVYDIVIGRQ